MHHRLLRLTIAALAALNALSAIGGGLVLLLGTYREGALIEAGWGGRFPLAWLRDTPFSDYTVPALILAVVVGGSSLLAVIAILIRRETGPLVALAAGLILVGYMVGEVALLRQGVSGIEAFYFTLGLVIFTLAAILRMREHPSPPVYRLRR